MNRYFVYEGHILRAAQSTLEGAMRYINKNRSIFCVAQAKDGLWDYGPYTMERQIQSEDYGTYRTQSAAIFALGKASNTEFQWIQS